MIKFIKRIFCKHDWWSVSPVLRINRGSYILCRCTKCGKEKLI